MYMWAPQDSPAGKVLPFVSANLVVLNDWAPNIRKWFINERPGRRRGGVANVISSSTDSVYGSVYLLSESDEKELDKSEGVSSGIYVKETLTVDFIGSTRRKDVPALVYVDKKHLKDGYADQEYIDTLNKGIADAFTIPHEYVDKSMRPRMILKPA
jgi:gamma-glutamylcyclotransferase